IIAQASVTSPDLANALEAILFVAGEPVTLDRLRSALSCDGASLESAIATLAGCLAARGVRLQRHADPLQFVTAPQHAGPVERFLGIQASSKPSAAALETLAIVAYRQPISRVQIEEIRGVGCERVLRSLAAQELIQEVGRGSGLGRPLLYGTTDVFLQR